MSSGIFETSKQDNVELMSPQHSTYKMIRRGVIFELKAILNFKNFYIEIDSIVLHFCYECIWGVSRAAECQRTDKAYGLHTRCKG